MDLDLVARQWRRGDWGNKESWRRENGSWGRLKRWETERCVSIHALDIFVNIYYFLCQGWWRRCFLPSHAQNQTDNGNRSREGLLHINTKTRYLSNQSLFYFTYPITLFYDLYSTVCFRSMWQFPWTPVVLCRKAPEKADDMPLDRSWESCHPPGFFYEATPIQVCYKAYHSDRGQSEREF